MAKRTLRPPADTQRSPDRERASFERNIQEKLDNTEYSIDDLSRVVFFTNQTTQGQQTELDLAQYARLIMGQMAGLNAKIEELQRQMEELRRLIWP